MKVSKTLNNCLFFKVIKLVLGGFFNQIQKIIIFDKDNPLCLVVFAS